MTEVPAVGSRVIAPNKKSVIVRLDPESGRRYIRYTSKKSNPPGKVMIKYLEKAKKTSKAKSSDVVMCSKKVSLPAMQQVAQAAGISIYDARPLKNIRGEMVQKPVGCSTLFQRIKAVNPDLLLQLGIKLKGKASGKPEVVQEVPSPVLPEESEAESDAESEAESDAESDEDDAFDVPLSEQTAKEPYTGSTAIVPYTLGDNTMDFGARHKVHGRIKVDNKMKVLYRGARGGYFYRRKGQKVYVKGKDLLHKIVPLKKTKKATKKVTKKSVTIAGRKRTLYKGKKGGMYYKSKGRKVYVK